MHRILFFQFRTVGADERERHRVDDVSVEASQLRGTFDEEMPLRLLPFLAIPDALDLLQVVEDQDNVGERRAPGVGISVA